MTQEPLLEGPDGQSMTKDDIWEMYTASLLERRDGADELLGIMVELHMDDPQDQRAFVAMSIELRVLSRVSSMFVNRAQLGVLAKKWGLGDNWLRKLKSVVAPEAPDILGLDKTL